MTTLHHLVGEAEAHEERLPTDEELAELQLRPHEIRYYRMLVSDMHRALRWARVHRWFHRGTGRKHERLKSYELVAVTEGRKVPPEQLQAANRHCSELALPFDGTLDQEVFHRVARVFNGIHEQRDGVMIHQILSVVRDPALDSKTQMMVYTITIKLA